MLIVHSQLLPTFHLFFSPEETASCSPLECVIFFNGEKSLRHFITCHSVNHLAHNLITVHSIRNSLQDLQEGGKNRKLVQSRHVPASEQNMIRAATQKTKEKKVLKTASISEVLLLINSGSVGSTDSYSSHPQEHEGRGTTRAEDARGTPT